MAKTKKITPAEALDLPIYNFEFDEGFTNRDYLKALLSNLWERGESFSGKYPFGNSGWEHDLEKGLVIAGIIEGEASLYNEETESYEDVVIDPKQSYTHAEALALDITITDQDAYDVFVFEMIEAL